MLTCVAFGAVIIGGKVRIRNPFSIWVLLMLNLKRSINAMLMNPEVKESLR